MKRSQLSYLLTVAGLLLLLLGAAAGWLLATQPARISLWIGGWALLALATSTLLYRFIAHYLFHVRTLVEEAELMLSANPAHRTETSGPAALGELSRVLNRFAVRHEALLDVRDAAIQAARAELEEERNLLAALMAELSEAVIVCTLQGEILLYNERARLLFAHSAGMSQSRARLGLGRSIFTLIDRQMLQHALDQYAPQQEDASHQSALHQSAPTHTSFIFVHHARQLRTRVAPFTDPSGARRGAVLLIEDMSQHSDEAAPRMPASGKSSATDARPSSHPEYYDFALLRDQGQKWGGIDIRKRPLRSLRCTVFDTETTGLDPQCDEIIAIGAVRIINGRLLRHERFDQLVNPQRVIPASATAIHGIDNAQVANAPEIERALPHFAAFAEESVLVGHNIAFDMRLLAAKEARTGVRLGAPTLDTLLLSAVAQPQQADHSLEAMARRFGVAVENRHTALGDALLAGALFLRLLDLLEAQGITTLGQALDASEKTYFARLHY